MVCHRERSLPRIAAPAIAARGRFPGLHRKPALGRAFPILLSFRRCGFQCQSAGVVARSLITTDGFGGIASIFPSFRRLSPAPLLFQKRQLEPVDVGRAPELLVDVESFGVTAELFQQRSLPVKLTDPLPE